VILRRVYLDMTGLPPTREELREFLADSSEEAYGRVVDRLLASTRATASAGAGTAEIWQRLEGSTPPSSGVWLRRP